MRATGLSTAAYEAQLRQEVARNQLAQAVIGGAVAPQVFVDTMIGYRTETRTADYMTVPLNMTRKIADPDDAILAEFYDAEKESFRKPELRQVTYLSLNAETMAETIEVSDADIPPELRRKNC